jgi:acetyltransferase-like isoleucine patch superfamily enzyme
MKFFIKNILSYSTIKLRKIAFVFFSKLFPEIKIFHKDIPWDKLGNYLENCQINNNSIVYPRYQLINVELNEYSYIAENSKISNTKIGKFCSIGPNLIAGWGIHPLHGISTSPIFYSKNQVFKISFAKENKTTERKEITIGNDVFIGMNVTILDGIKIGDGAVIGAGAVVSKDIPPYAVAVGNPVKVVKFRFTEEQIESLLKIKWWDFNKEKLSEIEKYFFEIDTFIEKNS